MTREDSSHSGISDQAIDPVGNYSSILLIWGPAGQETCSDSMQERGNWGIYTPTLNMCFRAAPGVVEHSFSKNRTLPCTTGAPSSGQSKASGGGAGGGI